ncbi:MAG TPA: tetraacyldisaccharide 4'-kinase [Candidatus Eisenbacteria bacterium]
MSAGRAAPTLARGRGLAGAVERAWSGEPGSVPWTVALAPVAMLYAAGSAAARRGAIRARRPASGVHVVAVGNLTVGGTGKTSLARWLALEAAATGGRGAVILRGHGGDAPSDRTGVVPDAAGYPLRAAADRYGDEAASHRAALPRSIAVLVDRDRLRAARVARDGYAASVAVLDDGWEQRRLAWDSLWVALDPRLPKGNGWALPAGPLRRPVRALAEADAIAFVLETAEEEVPEAALALARRHAPRAAIVRFRRVLTGLAPPGERGDAPAARGTAGGALVGAGTRAALLTAVGAPERAERFARAAGFDLVAHEAFPDHARVGSTKLRAVLDRAAARGAAVALLTEKDEHRWALPADAALPFRVLRTRLQPLDAVDALLTRFRAAAATGVS